MYVAAKLGPSAGSNCLPRVGMSRLRRFLERRVEECYRRNVARIVPLLQRELTKAESKLLSTGTTYCHIAIVLLCPIYIVYRCMQNVLLLSLSAKSCTYQCVFCCLYCRETYSVTSTDHHFFTMCFPPPPTHTD
jgi:hypothetical protein